VPTNENIDYGLSTDKILNKVVDIFKINFSHDQSGENLDIGSGTGALVRLIKSYSPRFRPTCVDYTEELMQDKSIEVDVVDLNLEKLPYQDNRFDFVSCTEVVEHLENYRLIIRETFRVTKAGGLVVFTTPNTLNLLSRVRYMWTGFQNLFGPLSVGRGEFFSAGGHITPVSYFFLAHSLAEAGFDDIEVKFDKKQTSAYPLMLIFYPLIVLFGSRSFSREKRKGFINTSNERLIQPINSIEMLLGRTIVVSARKK
jgi:SAM-dependent methyltransferase